MTDVKKELEAAYGMLAGLQVSGDAVDVFAEVRVALRRAMQGILEMEKTEKKED